MPYNVKIILDSMSDEGARLTTFELTYPRMVHSEFMTHRAFGRNAASSRAIPVEQIIGMVQNDPAMPVYWGKNQKGMIAEQELTGKELEAAKAEWLRARDDAVYHARNLITNGVHKQIVNRLLEPWAWITVVCTATEYGNFFNLRCATNAQPEIRHFALLMLDLYANGKPQYLAAGEWHLPYVLPEEKILWTPRTLLNISVARCGRVSYVRQGDVREIVEDEAFHDRCRDNGHWSVFEHQAMALNNAEAQSGNLRGFAQYRKNFLTENFQSTSLQELLEANREDIAKAKNSGF